MVTKPLEPTEFERWRTGLATRTMAGEMGVAPAAAAELGVVGGDSLSLRGEEMERRRGDDWAAEPSAESLRLRGVDGESRRLRGVVLAAGRGEWGVDVEALEEDKSASSPFGAGMAMGDTPGRA